MADVQTIDKLAVEITSHVTGAPKIESFTKALSGLADASRRINTGNLELVGENLRSFSASLGSVKLSEVKNFANSLSRLSEIKSDNLGNLDKMAASIRDLASVSGELGGLRNLVNALNRLSKADMKSFDSSKFNSLATTIRELSTSLSGVEGIDSKVSKLIDSLAKLANSGENVDKVSVELPQIGKALTTLIKDLQGVGTIDANITKLVAGIAQLANAGKKAGETTASLDKFGDAVVRLVNKIRGIGEINTNLANTIQGLGNLAQGGAKFGAVAATTTSSVNGLGNAFKRLGSIVGRVLNPFTSFAQKLGLVSKKSRSLASKLGLLYAKYWLLMRAIKAVGKLTGSAQDYVEAFNYFNVALKKVGEDNKKLYKRFGYKDAETYAESFQDRFTKLQKEMTGYNVNSRTGDLSMSKDKSLGLNIKDVMEYQAQITQITNSTGQLGEVSVMTADALSRLAVDLSSLTNTDLTQVQENLVSGFNGMTRAVYKYGVNITSANLQQIAYNHGVTDSVAKMSMASKQQLRLLGILEQTKVAWGDAAKTMNQPANQMRRLQAGFANLGRTIGSLFLPALQAIYPVLNGLVMVLQEFFEWIAKLLGVKLPDMSDSIAMPDIETPAEDAGDLADNTGKAAKNAKKLQDNLQGFDEINKLEKATDSDGSGKNGAGGIANPDFSKDIQSLWDQYKKLWNKRMKEMEDKARTFAEKIKNALIKGWKAGGDFTQLGKDFGKFISDGLAKIPWEKIQNGVNKLTRSFATFLNGVVYGTDWKVIGNTIAQAFNTIVGALYTWYDTFDFLALGTSLAEGFMEMINNIDWEKLGKMLGKKIRSFIQLAFGFITNINFKKIGESITTTINNFLAEMGRIDPRTGKSGWAELGKTFSDGAKGFLDTIIAILDGVDWDAVAKAISDFLGEIDWLGILKRIGEVIVKALWTAIKTAVKAFANDPIGVGGAIITVLGGLFAFGKLKGLIAVIKAGFSKVFGIGLKQGVASGIANAGLSAGGSAGGKGLFSGLVGKFKDWGKMAGGNFLAGFKYSGVLGGLKGLLSTSVSKLGFFGIGATAAVGLGKVGGNLINNAIDESESARNYARSVGEQRGRDDMTVGKANGETARTTWQKQIKDAKANIEKYKEAVERATSNMDFGGMKRYTDLIEQEEGRIKSLNNEFAKIQNQINADKSEAIGKKLYKLAKKGVIGWDEYNRYLKEAKNSTKTTEDAVGDVLSKTREYSGITRKLADDMQKANVPMEQQKAIMNQLKQKVMNNEISMKRYKEIVDKSKGSVTSLTKAISHIPQKKKVTVSFVPEGFKTISSYIQNLKSQSVTIPVNVQYNGQSGGTQSKKYQSMQTVKGIITTGGDQNAWTQMVNAGLIKVRDSGVVELRGSAKNYADELKKYGIKFKKYAQGGFIEDGVFTMNRGELAGKFDNGKSVVANNEQITQGFAQAITAALAPAIYSAVKDANADSSGGSQDVKVYLDGKQIAENSVKHIRIMNKSNGKSVFA